MSSMNQFDWKNATAVITGGASGIGRTVARELAAKGAAVVIGDIDENAIQQTVSEIQAAGGRATGKKTDVTQEADVAALMDAAVEFGGSINIVIPSAGIIKDGLMINTDRETGKVKSVMSTQQFRQVIDVNLVGSFITLREAAQRMADNGWGGVLYTISSINRVGQVGQINYSSTKAAVALWPQILSGEFHMRGLKNIRVVGIAPGYVNTAILQGMNQDALAGILKDVHIGRLIEPEEIAATIIAVAENGAIDGTTIDVTGGLTYGSRSIAKG